MATYLLPIVEGIMRLSVKALAITLALLWGIAVLLVGVINIMWPPYGGAFLNVADSVYPGLGGGGGGGFGSVIGRTLIATVDGAIAGAVVAWLYNTVLDRTTAT